MNDEQLDTLLQGDAQGSPWRPTPEFFEALQRDMAEVDVRLATEKPRSWLPIAAAAAIGALALGASYAFFVQERPDTAPATRAEMTQRSPRADAPNLREQTPRPQAKPTGSTGVDSDDRSGEPAIAANLAAPEPAASSASGAPAAGQPTVMAPAPSLKTDGRSHGAAGGAGQPVAEAISKGGGGAKPATASARPARKKAKGVSASPIKAPAPKVAASVSKPRTSSPPSTSATSAKSATTSGIKAMKSSSSRTAKVLGRMKPALQRCLMDLKPRPKSVTVTGRVMSGPDGRVRRVMVRTALPDPVSACVKKVVARGSFGSDPSVSFSVTIRLP